MNFIVGACVKVMRGVYNNATCRVVSVNNDNTLTVHCVGMPPNNHLTLAPTYFTLISHEQYNNVNNHHISRRSKSLRNKLKKLHKLHKSKRRKKSYRRSYRKTKVKRSKKLRRKNKFK